METAKLGIAAHLHVLLRRKTGRVTDTVWLASNLEYANEIIRFAHAKAVEESHPDLAEWADKLAALMTPSSSMQLQVDLKPGISVLDSVNEVGRYVRGIR
jgi:hypothetical protein